MQLFDTRLHLIGGFRFYGFKERAYVVTQSSPCFFYRESLNFLSGSIPFKPK